MKCQVTVSEPGLKKLKDCRQGVYIHPGVEHLIYFRTESGKTIMYNTSQGILVEREVYGEIEVMPFVGTLTFSA